MKYSLLVLIISLLISPAYAMQFGIVATVNNDVITNNALQERVSLIINSNGLPRSDEMRKRVLPQALQGLINEKLQQQKAAELGLLVDENDLDFAYSSIEQKNGLPRQPHGHLCGGRPHG